MPGPLRKPTLYQLALWTNGAQLARAIIVIFNSGKLLAFLIEYIVVLGLLFLAEKRRGFFVNLLGLVAALDLFWLVVIIAINASNNFRMTPWQWANLLLPVASSSCLIAYQIQLSFVEYRKHRARLKPEQPRS